MNDRLAYRIMELVGPEPALKKEAGVGAMSAGAGVGAAALGTAGYMAGGEGNRLIPTLAGMFGGGVGGAAMAEYFLASHAKQSGLTMDETRAVAPGMAPEAGGLNDRITNFAGLPAKQEAGPLIANLSKTQADRRNSRLAEAVLALRKESMDSNGEYQTSPNFRDKEEFEKTNRPNVDARKKRDAEDKKVADDKKAADDEKDEGSLTSTLKKGYQAVKDKVGDIGDDARKLGGTIADNPVPVASGVVGAGLGGAIGNKLGARGHKTLPTLAGAGIGAAAGVAAPAVYDYLAKKLAERQAAV